MDGKNFVNKLKALAPSKERLKKFNVSDEFIDKLISRYCCTIKTSKSVISTNDALLLLLHDYDCSKVEIGIVSFLQEVVEGANYYQIGDAEQDILVINKISLEVEVLDHDSLHHVIWKCASNSSFFLEALLLCADRLTSRLENMSQEEDGSVALQYVEICASKAGGEKYIDFYKMLLGYFD